MNDKPPEKSSRVVKMPWQAPDIQPEPGYALRKNPRNVSGSIQVGLPDIPELDGASLFVEARLKLYRARFHVHTASVLWEMFTNLDNGMVRVEFDAAKGAHYLRTDIGIPFDFRLSISDALRCLRSSLDYCVAALARSKDVSDEHIVFPFNKERKQIEASFKPGKNPKRQNAFYLLSLAYPDLEGKILNEIQPYSAEDGASAMGDFLWRLITMDNIDKHRLLSPTITFAYVKKAIVGGVLIRDCQFTGWSKDFPAITVLGAPDEPQPEPEFTADVVFPEGTRLAGKPVLSAFVEGSNFVSGVIDIFESAFDRKNVSG